MKYIGIKIGIGYVLAFLLLVGIGTVSFRNMNKLDTSIAWVGHTNEVLKEMNHIDIALLNAETGQRGYVITGDDGYLEPYHKGVEMVYESIDKARELTKDNPEQQSRIEDLQPLVDKKLAELNETINLRKTKGIDASIKVVLEDHGKIVMDKIRLLMTDIAQAEESLLEIRAIAQNTDVKATKLIIVLGITLGSIILALAAYVITNNISKPLGNLTTVAGNIAEGNVEVVVALGTRNDEVGLLARSFDNMIYYLKEMASVAEQIAEGDLTGTITTRGKQDKLGNSFVMMLEGFRAQVSQIINSVQTLSSATKEISTTIAQFSGTASETSTSVSETTTSLEQTRQIADLIREKTGKVAASAQSLAKASDDGKQATKDTIKAMAGIEEKMGLIADSIVSLSEQTQTIGEIINTVEDLSEQSNLLAVNASIEAAKVGEHGKGFAVVAQEIKNLSEQSKEATARVRTILTDIQKAASSSVMVTEQGSKAVASGVDQSVRASEAIIAMAAGIVESAQAASQIIASSQQQKTGMDQIVEAMISIDRASKQNVAGAVQLQEAAKGLTELGQNLSEIVARYRLN